MKILIKQNNKCDSRTCDVSEVNKETLLENSKMHISDVQNGMNFFAYAITNQASDHDHTKITYIDDFYRNFKTRFEQKDWWNMHQRYERHHFNNPEFIQADVNLIDILEQIVDGVMAGLARTGEYRQENMPDELLKKAYNNTVQLLLQNVELIKDQKQ